jgi:predicted permease
VSESAAARATVKKSIRISFIFMLLTIRVPVRNTGVGIIQDIRYGARLLRRSPWFTLVAVASLAIGLGSAVALFTFMNALLFRPLPGRGTADLHAIHTSGYEGSRYGSSSFADFRSYITTSPPLFASSCATARVQANLVVDGQSQAHPGEVMSGGCFDALRLRPQLGRLLSISDEAAVGDAPPIVISYSVWHRRFGAETGAAGRPVTVNGVPAVVVGVAPKGFSGLSLDSGAEFWVAPRLAPALTDADVLTSRGDRRFRIYVRLNTGVTERQATARLAAVATSLRDEDPRAWVAANGSTRLVTLLPEIESRFAQSEGERVAIALATFGAIAAIVAIACVNLATMVMARGAGRTRELNVRLALGASRRRLLRQLATESLLISATAGAAGVLLVAGALKLFDAYKPAEVPAFNMAVDWRIAVFAALLAIVTPVLFGLAPGAHALRLAIAEGIKGRVVSARRRWLPAGPRELLLVVQVAVSFALLIMTTLFLNAARPDPETALSQAARQITVVPIDFGSAEQTDADARALVNRLLQAMDTVPGVVTPTAVGVIPLTGSSIGFNARLMDRPDAEDLVLDGNVVAPGYFELNGMRRLAGRTFEARDRHGAAPVAVVSESMARRLWGAAPPVGRLLRMGKELPEIVGVVADVPYRSLDGPQPVIYIPLDQSPRTHRLLLQARLMSSDTSIALERALREVDPRIGIGSPTPLTQYAQQLLAPERIGQAVAGLAGVLQLGLALMAIWGLVAYAVERRIGEIAIRRALGATEGSIVGLMMQPSLWLLAVGTAIGCGAGIAAANVLHSEFTGLAPIEFAVAIPVAALLVIVVAIAAWLPARRAAAIEPASALKQN